MILNIIKTISEHNQRLRYGSILILRATDNNG